MWLFVLLSQVLHYLTWSTTIPSSLEQRKEGKSCDVKDSKCQIVLFFGWVKTSSCMYMPQFLYPLFSVSVCMSVCAHTCTVHMNMCGAGLFLGGHPHCWFLYFVCFETGFLTGNCVVSIEAGLASQPAPGICLSASRVQLSPTHTTLRSSPEF